MTGEELQVAANVHDEVLRYLKLRYLSVAISIMLIAPMLGVFVGVFAENRILSAAVEKTLEEAESQIGEAVATAELANDEVYQGLVEVRSVMQALELVMAGTPQGLATKMQLQMDGLTERMAGWNAELEELDRVLNGEMTENLGVLLKRAGSVAEMRDMVKGFERILQESQAAQALTQSYFKVHDLHMDLEVALFATDQLDLDEREWVELMSNNASDLSVSVKMYAEGEGEVAKQLHWPKIAFDEIRIEPIRKTTVVLGEGANDISPNYLVILSAQLKNRPGWWSYEPSEGSNKSLNLEGISAFDCIEVELHVDGRYEELLRRELSRVVRHRASDSLWLAPKHIRLGVVANREKLQLVTESVEERKGANLEVTPRYVPPPVPEEMKDGGLRYVFSELDIMSTITAEYLRACAEASKVRGTRSLLKASGVQGNAK